MNVQQVFTIFISLVIVGEAALLAVGMHIVKKSDNPWISLKNDLMLAFDVVIGSVLIMITHDSADFPRPTWFPLFTILGLTTHIFRFWEYLAGRQGAFCGSRPLFILNNLKLIGLVMILVLGS